MSLVCTSLVDAPLDTVFDWHERPGAVVRLSPPWLPVRVQEEAESLRDSRAVLRFPLGLRWVAQHGEYDPPRRFVDQLSSPLRFLLPWRHTHEFAAVGPGHTRVTDRVDTPVQARLLRPMFIYRHQQLADDLAAHRRACELGAQPKTIAVTGSSGLVGSALTAALSTFGHRVVRLVRHSDPGPAERYWNPVDPDPDLLAGVDAIIHLAGAPILGRFTRSHRRAVRESRIPPTRALAELAAKTAEGPNVLVCASAIGIYGPDRGDVVLTETSRPGDGFLAEVVRDWEAATRPASDAGIRVVSVRTGLVQSPRGGVLRVQYAPFLLGLGGRLGGGSAWQSWIGIDDLVDVYHRAVYDDQLSGPVNATAPQPVRGREYATTLGHVLHRPAIFRVSTIAPRLILGNAAAAEFASASQRVVPARLRKLGHVFRHPTLEAALQHLLGKETPPPEYMD